MNPLKTVVASRTARIGATVGLATAAVVGFATMSFATAAASYKLSPATGPGATAGQVITATGSGFQVGATVKVGTVEFQTAACGAQGANSATAVTSANYDVVSATKLVLKVPSLALGASSAPKAYYLCVYDATPTLMGSAKYTVYAAPTYTAISPAAGPSFGGQAITVTGTGFTAKTTATLGGQALTSIKVATDGNSFTAVTPAHSASATAVDLVVTTEGGPVTGTTAYTYKNAIQLVGNTHGPSTTDTVIDVTGVGFTSALAAANTHASVQIVKGGVFDKTNNTGTACANIKVVSDTELTCTVPIHTSTLGDGGYWVYVTDDTTTNSPTYGTVVSSGAAFTVGDF